MTIWSAEIKELETLSTSIKGRFPELEKELVRLIKADDENMVLLYSRRCLEVIITDLCECELKRPRKTEPLKGIIDKLHHEEKVPANIIASMHSLNSLSTFGAHPKEFDPEQVKPVLNNLTTIIKWYLKYMETQAISKPEAEKAKEATKAPEVATEQIQKPKKKLILLLSGLALFIVIIVIVLFAFGIIGGEKQTEELEKSVAVLPFLDDSQDKENTSFINGLMDEILINLQTIEDLRVISRNSVEQYRGPAKPSTPDIATALRVNYIVEGSGQKYGNTFRLRVQLIEAAEDRHVWGDSYEQEINEVKDIFNIQSQIAQAIAAELKAVITPEEKQLIEKTPTSNLTAYDFYQQGRDEHWKYWLVDDKEALERAENRYQKALEFDSTFARAYIGLADVYYDRYYWKEYFTEEFLDSFLILTNIALSYDDQLAEAYRYRGVYYEEKGKDKQALMEYNQALYFNPNDWRSYRNIAYLYSEEPIKEIEYLEKALSLNHGSSMSYSLRNLGYAYLELGFIEKGMHNFEEALAVDGDSSEYLLGLAYAEFSLENYEKVLEISRRLHELDSMWMPPGLIYNLTGNHQEIISLFEKTRKYGSYKGWEPIVNIHRIGVALWKMGEYNKAKDYFNQHVQYALESIELGRSYATSRAAYYDLAGDYAWLGEKEKALQYLNELNKKQFFELWWVVQIRIDPLFEPIRDEPEYKRIVRDAETKYQAEHERVRKWLEENDLPG